MIRKTCDLNFTYVVIVCDFDLFQNFVIAMSQLKLTKPAPEWRGTAVVNGEFKEISISDYRGKYLVFFFYPLDL